MITPLTEAELVATGEKIGAALPPRSVLTLEGDLGAGKTTLVQALARGLGVHERATSPTYALVHRYQGRRGPVFHLDCYRLRDPEEAAELDWESLLRDGDALLIEWPEKAGAYVPPATRRFRLHHLPDFDRRGLEEFR
ncbi:MAG TPA: tRNA (adenosine(37)-N6)-threonylcarbamoyltransferase complex ATPase subunit type 1 TsaE [Gemmatimonadales bacterium]|nr:tRNA (adenosine(37)-N6)-threonylcarbamoyltransferase complex ATPase subunit type 1 TsaE [Gemmatimonadales bacterium]